MCCSGGAAVLPAVLAAVDHQSGHDRGAGGHSAAAAHRHPGHRSHPAQGRVEHPHLLLRPLRHHEGKGIIVQYTVQLQFVEHSNRRKMTSYSMRRKNSISAISAIIFIWLYFVVTSKFAVWLGCFEAIQCVERIPYQLYQLLFSFGYILW